MYHNEETEYRGWKIVCKISPVTKRSRFHVWSANGVNMGARDTLIAAEHAIDYFVEKRS